MFIKVKIQPFVKLGYLATAQTSACQSAGAKGCAFLAFRTSEFFLHPAVNHREDATSHTELASCAGHPVSWRTGLPSGVLRYSRDGDKHVWPPIPALRSKREVFNQPSKTTKSFSLYLRKSVLPNSEPASHHAHVWDIIFPNKDVGVLWMCVYCRWQLSCKLQSPEISLASQNVKQRMRKSW